MSAFNQTRGSNRRVNNVQARERLSRQGSASRGKRPVSAQDSYLYALRVAYLAYLTSFFKVAPPEMDFAE